VLPELGGLEAFPAAAEGLVEGDEVSGEGAVALGEGLLGAQQGALGGETLMKSVWPSV